MKLGIALAGGGAKGAAHLGVLQALEENGIRGDMYVGASAGAIVATAKAFGYGNKLTMQLLSQVDRSFLDFNYWEIIKDIPHRLQNIDAIMKGKKLRRFLNEHFNLYICNVKYPLSIVSTDIRTGQQVIFSSKEIPVDPKMDSLIKVYGGCVNLGLSQIIYASSAIPGVYPPVYYGDHKLVDGAVTNALPANVAKAMGADKIIAIDLDGDRGATQTHGIINMLVRSIDILIEQNVDYSLWYTEKFKYISPDLKDIGSFDFDRTKEAYDLGYQYGNKVAHDVYDFVYEDA